METRILYLDSCDQKLLTTIVSVPFFSAHTCNMEDAYCITLSNSRQLHLFHKSNDQSCNDIKFFLSRFSCKCLKSLCFEDIFTKMPDFVNPPNDSIVSYLARFENLRILRINVLRYPNIQFLDRMTICFPSLWNLEEIHIYITNSLDNYLEKYRLGRFIESALSSSKMLTIVDLEFGDVPEIDWRRLTGFQRLKSFKFFARISADCFTEMLRFLTRCSNTLREVYLTSNLIGTELDGSLCRNLIIELAKKPNINKIKFNVFSISMNGREEYIDGVDEVLSVLREFKSLKELILHHINFTNYSMAIYLREISSQLTHLSLVFCRFDRKSFFEILHNGLPVLETLTIDCKAVFKELDLAEFLSKCKKLKKCYLNLFTGYDLVDETEYGFDYEKFISVLYCFVHNCKQLLSTDNDDFVGCTFLDVILFGENCYDEFSGICHSYHLKNFDGLKIFEGCRQIRIFKQYVTQAVC